MRSEELYSYSELNQMLPDKRRAIDNAIADLNEGYLNFVSFIRVGMYRHACIAYFEKTSFLYLLNQIDSVKSLTYLRLNRNLEAEIDFDKIKNLYDIFYSNGLIKEENIEYEIVDRKKTSIAKEGNLIKKELYLEIEEENFYNIELELRFKSKEFFNLDIIHKKNIENAISEDIQFNQEEGLYGKYFNLELKSLEKIESEDKKVEWFESYLLLLINRQEYSVRIIVNKKPSILDEVLECKDDVQGNSKVTVKYSKLSFFKKFVFQIMNLNPRKSYRGELGVKKFLSSYSLNKSYIETRDDFYYRFRKELIDFLNGTNSNTISALEKNSYYFLNNVEIPNEFYFYLLKKEIVSKEMSMTGSFIYTDIIEKIKQILLSDMVYFVNPSILKDYVDMVFDKNSYESAFIKNKLSNLTKYNEVKNIDSISIRNELMDFEIPIDIYSKEVTDIYLYIPNGEKNIIKDISSSKEFEIKGTKDYIANLDLFKQLEATNKENYSLYIAKFNTIRGLYLNRDLNIRFEEIKKEGRYLKLLKEIELLDYQKRLKKVQKVLSIKVFKNDIRKYLNEQTNPMVLLNDLESTAFEDLSVYWKLEFLKNFSKLDIYDARLGIAIENFILENIFYPKELCNILIKQYEKNVFTNKSEKVLKGFQYLKGFYISVFLLQSKTFNKSFDNEYLKLIGEINLNSDNKQYYEYMVIKNIRLCINDLKNIQTINQIKNFEILNNEKYKNDVYIVNAKLFLNISIGGINLALFEALLRIYVSNYKTNKVIHQNEFNFVVDYLEQNNSIDKKMISDYISILLGERYLLSGDNIKKIRGYLDLKGTSELQIIYAQYLLERKSLIDDSDLGFIKLLKGNTNVAELNYLDLLIIAYNYCALSNNKEGGNEVLRELCHCEVAEKFEVIERFLANKILMDTESIFIISNTIDTKVLKENIEVTLKLFEYYVRHKQIDKAIYVLSRILKVNDLSSMHINRVLRSILDIMTPNISKDVIYLRYVVFECLEKISQKDREFIIDEFIDKKCYVNELTKQYNLKNNIIVNDVLSYSIDDQLAEMQDYFIYNNKFLEIVNKPIVDKDANDIKNESFNDLVFKKVRENFDSKNMYYVDRLLNSPRLKETKIFDELRNHVNQFFENRFINSRYIGCFFIEEISKSNLIEKYKLVDIFDNKKSKRLNFLDDEFRFKLSMYLENIGGEIRSNYIDGRMFYENKFSFSNKHGKSVIRKLEEVISFIDFLISLEKNNIYLVDETNIEIYNKGIFVENFVCFHHKSSLKVNQTKKILRNIKNCIVQVFDANTEAEEIKLINSKLKLQGLKELLTGHIEFLKFKDNISSGDIESMLKYFDRLELSNKKQILNCFITMEITNERLNLILRNLKYLDGDSSDLEYLMDGFINKKELKIEQYEEILNYILKAKREFINMIDEKKRTRFINTIKLRLNNTVDINNYKLKFDYCFFQKQTEFIVLKDPGKKLRKAHISRFINIIKSREIHYNAENICFENDNTQSEDIILKKESEDIKLKNI